MEEELAFSDWINTNLGQDPTLAHILPIQVGWPVRCVLNLIEEAQESNGK